MKQQSFAESWTAVWCVVGVDVIEAAHSFGLVGTGWLRPSLGLRCQQVGLFKSLTCWPHSWLANKHFRCRGSAFGSTCQQQPRAKKVNAKSSMVTATIQTGSKQHQRPASAAAIVAERSTILELCQDSSVLS